MHRVFMGRKALTPTKLICVGKNFPDHIAEMGGARAPAEPVLFLKPNSAIAFDPREVRIPAALGLLHHEVELCVAVGRGGARLTPEEARACIAGFGVAIDFTLRERQRRAKEAGEPWALAKGFDASAVVGPLRDARGAGDASALEMLLSVNGEARQRGNTREMLFAPEIILSFASQFMTIEPGDLLLCGTPAGVGEVQDGDEIVAEIAGLPQLRFHVTRGSESRRS
jgi:2-keto-4-pentenoate hydratase/2-oxohepta-3-ene-1,7-dioic acid hydratase in catechol pathway